MKTVLERLVQFPMANTLAHVIGFSLILTLVLVFDQGILTTSRNRIRENGQRVSQLRDLIQKNQGLRDGVRRVRQRIETEVVDIKPQDLSWVATAHESEFLADVSRLARESGLKIDSFKRGQISARENFSSLQITMKCQGDFASLYQVTQGVENLPFLVRVTACQIDNSQFESRVTADVVFTLYFDFKSQVPVNDKVASSQ